MAATDADVVARVDHPRPGVAMVTLDRPETLNALSIDGARQLTGQLDELAADGAVRVVVLTGAGRGFCSGLDLGAVAAPDGEGTMQQAYAVQEAFARLVSRVRSMPQVVIAAVNGPAVGAGLAIALAADLRVCDDRARFSAAFVRLGLSGCELGVSYLLPRLVGPTLAFEMMTTGRLVESDEAERRGLVLRMVPDGEVVTAALAIADDVCRNAPFGIRMTKQVMWTNLAAAGLESAMQLENRTQVLCAATADHREAVAAFVERRPASFEDR